MDILHTLEIVSQIFLQEYMLSHQRRASKINFGISNTSTASYAATPTDFDPLTTYLVIVKYNISAAGDASLWIYLFHSNIIS